MIRRAQEFQRSTAITGTTEPRAAVELYDDGRLMGTTVADDHQAIRERVGLMDWSTTGEFEVKVTPPDDAEPATTSDPLAIALDPGTGVWSIAGQTSWIGKYYLYEVEVYVHSTG